MHSGMMGMVANPMDLFLGLGAKQTPQTAAGSGDFSRLLALFPQMPVIGGASTGGDSPAISEKMTLPETPAGMTEISPVLIPERLANVLGMVALPSPESNNIDSSPEQPEVTIPARAGLLLTDNGSGPAAYLRIVPDEAVLVDSALIPDGSDDSEGMLLPMRLRTVEQTGNGIIADAVLQTATGEDVSVRLQLALNGTDATYTGTDRTPVMSPETDAKVITATEKQILPRLLNDLGVKVLSIEQVAEDPVRFAETSAPRIISEAGIRPDFGLRRMAVDNVIRFDTVQTGTSAESSGRVGAAVLPEQSDAGTEGNASFGRDTAGAEMLKPAFSQTGSVGAATGISAVFEPILAETSTPITATSDTAVRFYDLDNKLDQLKSSPGHKIQIQLVPARLGKMDLSIVSHRGTVTVNLTVDSEQARQAVQKNIGQLESRLAASGIKADGFQIHVNQSNKAETFAHQYNPYQQGGSADHQRGGGYSRWMRDQKQMAQLARPEAGFDGVLVNFLA